MVNRWLAVTAIGTIVALPITARGAETSDTAAVLSVWESVDAAWNARDAKRFSRLYTEDVSFDFVDRGQSLDGRAAILNRFEDRFPTYSPDLRHRTTIAKVSAIASGVLGVDGKVRILRIGPDDDAVLSVLKTFAIFAVMTRKDESFQIRALRIYELQSPASP